MHIYLFCLPLSHTPNSLFLCMSHCQSLHLLLALQVDEQLLVAVVEEARLGVQVRSRRWECGDLSSPMNHSVNAPK